MIQELVLEEDESLRWEARPAPRCYTFRHWRHSVFGLIFLAICSYWQVLGVSMAETYAVWWLAWLPLPFVLTGFYFFVGHLVQARLEWNHVYYAITNRRVIAQRGLARPKSKFIELSDLTYFSLHRQGEQLGTLRIHNGTKQQLVLHCIEHPHRAAELLEEAIANNEARNMNMRY
jgi:hypothetical protein